MKPCHVVVAVLAPWMTSVAVGRAEPASGDGETAVRIELTCDQVAPSDALDAALALELAAVGWRLADGDSPAWLRVQLEAVPCRAGAPLRITVRDGTAEPLLVLEGVDLPERQRARVLALLLADVIADLAPREPAIAVAVTSPIASPVAARSVSAPGDPVVVARARDSMPPLGATVSVALTHREYLDAGTHGEGARVAVARSLPWPRPLSVGLDLGADHLSTRFGFDLRSVRAGLVASVHVDVAPRVAIAVAGRGEVAAAWPQEHPIQTVEVVSRWSGTVSGVLAGDLAISSTVGVRVELEAGRTVAARPFLRMFTEAGAPPADEVAPFAGTYVALSLGVSVR